jgi:hypothetical protein
MACTGGIVDTEVEPGATVLGDVGLAREDVGGSSIILVG